MNIIREIVLTIALIYGTALVLQMTLDIVELHYSNIPNIALNNKHVEGKEKIQNTINSSEDIKTVHPKNTTSTGYNKYEILFGFTASTILMLYGVVLVHPIIRHIFNTRIIELH